MSGLNQRFTKPSLLNWGREFESRSLRIIPDTQCLALLILNIQLILRLSIKMVFKVPCDC